MKRNGAASHKLEVQGLTKTFDTAEGPITAVDEVNFDISGDEFFTLLGPNSQGAWANIPPKSNRKDPICFSPHLYKARNLVERFFNKIKHFRRIATRYVALRQARSELHGDDQARLHSYLAASL